VRIDEQTAMSTAETGSDVSNVAAKSRCHGVDGRRQTDSRRRDLDGLLKSLDVVRVLIFLAYVRQHVRIYRQSILLRFSEQAQLSQKDHGTLRVMEYFAKSFKVTEGHSQI